MTTISLAFSAMTGATCLMAYGFPCHLRPKAKLYRHNSRPCLAGSRAPLRMASDTSAAVAPRSCACSSACLENRMGFISFQGRGSFLQIPPPPQGFLHGQTQRRAKVVEGSRLRVEG